MKLIYILLISMLVSSCNTKLTTHRGMDLEINMTKPKNYKLPNLEVSPVKITNNK